MRTLSLNSPTNRDTSLLTTGTIVSGRWVGMPARRVPLRKRKPKVQSRRKPFIWYVKKPDTQNREAIAHASQNLTGWLMTWRGTYTY